MLVPVRCPGCGLPIADVAVIYNRLRFARARAILKTRDVVPTQAVLDAALQVDMSDVLAKLRITKDHCIRALTTAMDFRVYY